MSEDKDISRRDVLKVLAAAAGTAIIAPQKLAEGSKLDTESQPKVGPHEKILLEMLNKTFTESGPVEFRKLERDKEFFDAGMMIMLDGIYSSTLTNPSVSRLGRTGNELFTKKLFFIHSLANKVINNQLVRDRLPLSPADKSESKVVLVKRRPEDKASSFCLLVAPDPKLNLDKYIAIEGDALLRTLTTASMWINTSEEQRKNDLELVNKYLTDDPSIELKKEFSFDDVKVQNIFFQYFDFVTNNPVYYTPFANPSEAPTKPPIPAQPIPDHSREV